MSFPGNDEAPGACGPAGSASTLQWSSISEFCGLVLRGRTFRTASVVAAVVGTVLSVVNDGGDLFAGRVGAITGLRLAANYVVPYAVASIGYLAPFRRRRPAPR